MYIVSTLNENRIDKEIRKLLAYLSSGAADAQPINTKLCITNYDYKRRGVVSPKIQFFVNVHKVENVNGGGQKNPKSCQRSL